MKSRRTRLEYEALVFLEFLGLSGLAIAQPVLDVFGRAPEEFVAHPANGAAIVTFGLAIVLAPALALWLLELGSSMFGRRARTYVHGGLVGIMVAVLALEVTKRNTEWPRTTLLGVAVVVGAAAVALAPLKPVRSWLRVLAIAPLFFLGVFLFTTPIRPLLVARAGEPVHVAIAKPAPVVMVVLDELPTMSLLDGTGHIDRELFPNLATLADGATWYRNHTTVSSQTYFAVPAMLSGSYPTSRSQGSTVASHPHNLFTLLGDTYEIHARERFTSLCPSDICRGATKASVAAVGPLLEDALKVWGGIASPNRDPKPKGISLGTNLVTDGPADVRQFVRDLAPSRQPRLDYLHVLLPHVPWNWLPSGQRYDAPGLPGFAFGKWQTERHAEVSHQRHLLQLQLTDALVGRIIGKLKQLGTYDRTLLVVTADHGVSFDAQSQPRILSRTNYPEILWSPLFVKAPDQTEGATSDAAVRSVDLLPTLADMLGIDVPWRLDGTSALDRGVTRPKRLRALLEGGFARVESDDDFVDFDGVRGYRRVLESHVPRGQGGPDVAVLQTGRFGALVGQRLDALEVRAAVDYSARLDRAARYRAVVPEGDKPPVYISGSVRTRRPVAVAISVNGVIGGWSESYGSLAQNQRIFLAMVPVSLLRTGVNDIRVFAIAEDAGSATLRPVELSDKR